MFSKFTKRTALLTASAALVAAGAMTPTVAFAAPAPTGIHAMVPNDNGGNNNNNNNNNNGRGGNNNNNNNNNG
ncbi:hypothetical protein, partial [Saccharothrix sp. ST-888]|uniref:hypothetical protein n=1 Tax=Saccharothrix sp. ST-888 TaxID=1427391 RepID=UPI0018CE4F1F